MRDVCTLSSSCGPVDGENCLSEGGDGGELATPQGSTPARRLPPPPVGVGVEMRSGCCPVMTYGDFFPRLGRYLPPVR